MSLKEVEKCMPFAVKLMLKKQLLGVNGGQMGLKINQHQQNEQLYIIYIII